MLAKPTQKKECEHLFQNPLATTQNSQDNTLSSLIALALEGQNKKKTTPPDRTSTSVDETLGKGEESNVTLSDETNTDAASGTPLEVIPNTIGDEDNVLNNSQTSSFDGIA